MIKMRISKKILAISLSILMAISMMPFTAYAADAKPTATKQFINAADLADMPTANGPVSFDYGYKFTAKHDASTIDSFDSKYKYYAADYVIKADSDIAAGAITIGGQYDTYGSNWATITPTETITANTEIRLLKTDADQTEDIKTRPADIVFRLLFKNWKLFLPLILFAVVFNVALVGLMSEGTYVKFQTVLGETNQKVASGTPVGNFTKAGLLLVSTVASGGLSSGLSGVQIIFAVISFLLIWLITIYLLRFRLAGKTVRLRDGFYNALTPLLSTFVIFALGFLACVPIFVVIFTYSAAVQTDFLSTPFYALVFFLFALALLLLSLYLLSGVLLALIAVSAPGLYPLVALRTANNLILSRRIRFIVRIVFLVVVLALSWVIVMLPLITLDLILKQHISWLAGFPFIPLCLLFMTCFSFTYLTAYLYLYYRRMLQSEDNR